MDIINSFPGYEFSPYGIPVSRYDPGVKITEKHKSIYKGEDPSEGGYVFAVPGMYGRTVSFDVAGMHPASIIVLNKFGDATKTFKEIRDARLAIKHHDFQTARTLMNGRLAKYLDNEEEADNLAKALKLVLNSTYGIAAATFDNPLRDSRDVDNIIAKRGALFMIGLKQDLISKGYKVVHCKTDGIKVLDPDEEISNYIFDYGKRYGYDFEIEDEYQKFCLVNDAVYIAKYEKPKKDKKTGKDIWWTATGAQFAQPYVFKSLFSKEPITFNDMCETKSVTTSLYLDMNEGLGEEEHNYQFVGRVGQFCPMKPGTGGGILLREKEGKYYAVTGTKGYRWLESEIVKELGKENDIDKSYYESLVVDARDSIKTYGDFEWFVS